MKNNEIKKNVSHEKRKHPQEMLKNRSRFIHQRFKLKNSIKIKKFIKIM